MVKGIIPVAPQTTDRIVQIGAAMGGFVGVSCWTISLLYDVVVPVEVGISASTFLTFVVQRALPQ
jgi:hypothetical protein